MNSAIYIFYKNKISLFLQYNKPKTWELKNQE